MFLLFVSLSLLGVPEVLGQDRIDSFVKKIRPVLVERCNLYHLAKSARTGMPMGKLQPDTREGVQRGGCRSPAVVPRQPDQSILIAALMDAEQVIPNPVRVN